MFILGLDNGIYVKSNRRNLTREDMPQGIVFPFDKDYTNGIEILYWRKNWGLRNAVMNHFGWRSFSADQYNFNIETPSQVLDFIEIIASFLDEERWEDEGDSIWSYKEIRPVLIQDIINLALIYAFMCENPDVYLVFYDSY